ncbi:hypothetical protein HDV62DRAFT_96799 [Trichoderma sp. SZMC 28011]
MPMAGCCAARLLVRYMNATCNFQCISRHTAVLYGRHMQMGLDWTGLIHSSIRSTTDVAPIDTCRLATTISAEHCPRLNSTRLYSTRFSLTSCCVYMLLSYQLYLQYVLICLISTNSAQFYLYLTCTRTKELYSYSSALPPIAAAARYFRFQFHASLSPPALHRSCLPPDLPSFAGPVLPACFARLPCLPTCLPAFLPASLPV